MPSLSIIVPDGNNIKKEQIHNLINSFSRKSIYTLDSIYVIKEAEKMNKEASNTMLKFLEEPEDNIIGFFLTNNVDNILPTIQSRCEIIDCIFEESIIEELNIEEEKYEMYLDIIKKYLYNIECERKYLILYNEDFEELTREDTTNIFKIIFQIYKSYLNKKDVSIKNDFSYIKEFNINNIYKKTELILEILKELSYNVNVNLLLDRFVLEMDGINNEVI